MNIYLTFNDDHEVQASTEARECAMNAMSVIDMNDQEIKAVKDGDAMITYDPQEGFIKNVMIAQAKAHDEIIWATMMVTAHLNEPPQLFSILWVD